MPSITAEQARAVLREAELLCTPEQIDAALDRLASAITARLEHCDPLVLVVMSGAFIPAAQLLERLQFPLQIGYLHATRYRGKTRGAGLNWLRHPQVPMLDRRVLLVDDILDEGQTLLAVRDACLREGAKEVRIAVLTSKLHDRRVPGIAADYIGVELPDRYVFGFGMDYYEQGRNLPGIYAI